MRYRFWLWVHDALEKAWHRVYYNKLRTVDAHMRHTMVREPYNVTYAYHDSKTGETTPAVRREGRQFNERRAEVPVRRVLISAEEIDEFASAEPIVSFEIGLGSGPQMDPGTANAEAKNNVSD